MDARSRVAAMRYRCSRCSELHEGLPELTFGLPEPIFQVPAADRSERCLTSSDQCVLDNEHFFIRCILVLPIVEADYAYGIGAWSSLSAANFRLYGEHWDAPARAGIGPFFGWFCNVVPTFPDCKGLKCSIRPRDDGLRPLIDLEPTDHPLAIAQRNGITLDRALEIVGTISGIKFVVK